jgi:hypothetical protein
MVNKQLIFIIFSLKKMDRREYLNKANEGFFTHRFDKITPFTINNFHRCYSLFVNVFYDIFMSWKNCPYRLYDEIIAWAKDNFIFLELKYLTFNITSNQHIKPEIVKKDIATLIDEMKELEDAYLMDEINHRY